MKFLVAGLGNIGQEYEGTRHNMGFAVLDAFADAYGTAFSEKRYGSIAECSAKGASFMLLKPSTYMNLSGKAVHYWMAKLKIPLSSLLVVCDDINLPFGTMRMRSKGSDGGHNGLKDIDLHLLSDEYARMRLGIGNGFAEGHQADYVLSKLMKEEREKLPDLLGYAVKAIDSFAFDGVEKAMSQYNKSYFTVEFR
ncbi:MAG: aminoacyl-tRNA hydrolase [Bacteroidales bacterium]|jgi:PTH1 family peptidyl-tRNA hydrolase|nr:aminoacyl-tRNA hydrolase [Bacteroidales bacterium]MCI2121280.1 aminoacyl-tRNA hydrolase [Bacteroidales bacterium]MCI2145230.1 aminoacyl-tRNA hydrolase [Bacteroidales bacterium]